MKIAFERRPAMKRSRTKLPNRLNGLTVFAGEKPESYDTLVQRAHDRVKQLKESCQDWPLSFEYDGELVRGKFVDVVEGDFPGTFMIVLRIPSSRMCYGPCFLRLEDEHVNGIVVTGKGGLVGITAKALPQRQSVTVPSDQSDLVRCA
jgi:hypothetical protein